MNRRLTFASAAQWLAFASSVVIVLGIAPSQILLGLSLAAMLASGVRPRLPPSSFLSGYSCLELYWQWRSRAIRWPDFPR